MSATDNLTVFALPSVSKEAGGATVDVWTGAAVTLGAPVFAVSVAGAEVQVGAAQFFGPAQAEILAEYCADHLASLALPGAHLGVWADGETVYLDVSILVYSLFDALAIGAANGQKAVFAFAAGEVIPVA